MKPTPDMSTTLKEDLERVLEKLDRLERLIKKQNGMFGYNTDNTPQLKYPTNPFPAAVNAIACSKCGLSIENIKGYHCLDSDCPTSIKVT